jgi:hypothetical protein
MILTPSYAEVVAGQTYAEGAARLGRRREFIW